MKALIAFIGMAVVILALIEINERRKAKRKKEDCPKEQSDASACTDCSLVELCDKKPTVSQ
jgi:hypothetical protein